jgi:signal transduction histidine kinase
VQARPRYRSGDFIEILAPAQPLKLELRAFLLNSLLMSLLISLVAGGLLYGGLAFLVLQPLRRVTRSIEGSPSTRDRGRYAQRPPRRDRPGRARTGADAGGSAPVAALARPPGGAGRGGGQDQPRPAQHADLGPACIRAIGRFSADPQVAKALPRLERALSRAAALSRNVLEYGKSEEPAPVSGCASPWRPPPPAAAEDAGLTRGRAADQVPAGAFRRRRRPDQLHRILVNLMRNARQAIEADAARGARKGKGVVRIEAGSDGDCVILIATTGRVFRRACRNGCSNPSSAAGRPAARGLGLTISRELAANHGGELTLVDTGPRGTSFEIRLPHSL